MWQVTSGSAYCQLTSGGSCVTEEPRNIYHGNNERCTITALVPLYATATEFHTEAHHDYITIGSTRYSGTVGPTNVQMAASSTMTWYSDHSVTQPGWTICGTAAMPPAPPQPPASAAGAARTTARAAPAPPLPPPNKCSQVLDNMLLAVFIFLAVRGCLSGNDGCVALLNAFLYTYLLLILYLYLILPMIFYWPAGRNFMSHACNLPARTPAPPETPAAAAIE